MSAPAPGWYPDPSGGHGRRWWTGLGWSEATQPSAAAVGNQGVHGIAPSDPVATYPGAIGAPPVNGGPGRPAPEDPTSAYPITPYPTSAYPTAPYPTSAYPTTPYPTSAYPTTPLTPAPVPFAGRPGAAAPPVPSSGHAAAGYANGPHTPQPARPSAAPAAPPTSALSPTAPAAWIPAGAAVAPPSGGGTVPGRGVVLAPAPGPMLAPYRPVGIQAPYTPVHTGVMLPPRGVWRSPRDTRPTVTGISTAFAAVFARYAQFDGRAGRPEYWYWTLLNALVIAGVYAVAMVTIFIPFLPVILLFMLLGAWVVGAYIPSVAVTVRRLRDAGQHWAWIFLSAVPFGSIVVLVFLTQPSRYP